MKEELLCTLDMTIIGAAFLTLGSLVLSRTSLTLYEIAPLTEDELEYRRVMADLEDAELSALEAELDRRYREKFQDEA